MCLLLLRHKGTLLPLLLIMKQPHTSKAIFENSIDYSVSFILAIVKDAFEFRFIYRNVTNII